MLHAFYIVFRKQIETTRIRIKHFCCRFVEKMNPKLKHLPCIKNITKLCRMALLKSFKIFTGDHKIVHKLCTFPHNFMVKYEEKQFRKGRKFLV